MISKNKIKKTSQGFHYILKVGMKMERGFSHDEINKNNMYDWPKY